MRKPTVSQERLILRGVIAKTRLDLETLVRPEPGGRIDPRRIWGVIERLDNVMRQFGIEGENPRRMP